MKFTHKLVAGLFSWLLLKTGMVGRLVGILDDPLRAPWATLFALKIYPERAD